MNIPVRNVFLLLCYAWDVLSESDLIDVDALEHHSTQELMASVLLSGMRHVMRRGLERQFKEVREDSSSLRGRIDLQESVRRLLLPKAVAHMVHEELSPNFLPNQIIKATIRLLIGVDDLSSSTKNELASVYRALWGISDIPLKAGDIARVRLHGNNRAYRLLMEVCNLVLDNLLPDEEGYGRRFRDFTRDESRMRILFQKFVTNLLIREQSAYRVASKVFRWQNSERIFGSQLNLPRMETDLVLTSGSSHIIVDTKFTNRICSQHYNSSSVRTEHLYQLWAYVTNLYAKVEHSRDVHGVLLYPTVSVDLDEGWIVQGHHLRVMTVDLNSSFELIKKRLLSIGDLTSPLVKPLHFEASKEA